jgi:hypothetical protein
MEELCVNYCVLVSVVFDNMEKVTEVEFQVTNRQILVQFLIHWSHLLPPFSRISAYAVNSLIPVLQLSEIFVEGFNFDRSLLDLGLKCQLDGYFILDRLLLFHMDGLLDEFFRQMYLLNGTESVQFRDAIVTVVVTLNDHAPLVSHVGALILAGLFC